MFNKLDRLAYALTLISKLIVYGTLRLLEKAFKRR
jgi:hypothetical protein